MSQRQKQFALGALVLLFGLFGADQLWSEVVAKPRLKAQTKHDKLVKAIRKRKLQIKTAKQSLKQLKVWRQQSLPADVLTARTLYQGWLHQLVESTGLGQRVVDSGSPQSQPGYRVLPFTIRGTGTMQELTDLLYQFYRAPHLHRIRTLSLTPAPTGDQLNLSLAIEALIVSGCDRKDRLAEGTSTTLASNLLQDYRILPERNLIGQGPRVGYAEMTELTAVLKVAGVAEAWFMNRMDDQLHKLHVGQRLKIGWFEGRVVEIEGDDVILDDDNQRWLLTRGDRLVDATALPPEH